MFERVRGVDLDPLDHEADVVGDAVAVEIWKIKKKLQVRLQERIKIHSNSVITNNSGLAKFVRYNRVDLCSK